MKTDTPATIRAVALEMFSTRGYEQTSLREIAERVGLTKASLYYHYPSKQDLLLDIIGPLVRAWERTADHAESLPHTPANIRSVLGGCLDALLGDRAAAAMFVRDVAAVVAAVAPIWDRLLDVHTRLHTWLAGPDPGTGDTIRAIAAMEVLGAAIGSTAQLPHVSDDELRRTLLDAAAAVLRLRRTTTADRRS